MGLTLLFHWTTPTMTVGHGHSFINQRTTLSALHRETSQPVCRSICVWAQSRLHSRLHHNRAITSYLLKHHPEASHSPLFIYSYTNENLPLLIHALDDLLTTYFPSLHSVFHIIYMCVCVYRRMMRVSAVSCTWRVGGEGHCRAPIDCSMPSSFPLLCSAATSLPPPTHSSPMNTRGTYVMSHVGGLGNDVYSIYTMRYHTSD